MSMHNKSEMINVNNASYQDLITYYQIIIAKIKYNIQQFNLKETC